MATERLQMGPDTVEVTVSVTRYQLLEVDPAHVALSGQPPRMRVAQAGSKTVYGVAADNADPRATDPATGPAIYRPTVACIRVPMETKAKYAANATLGQLLVAAATGQVTPYTAGTSTHDQIVGRCTQPEGVTSGSYGRIRLYI